MRCLRSISKGVEGAYPWQLSGGMQQRVAIARAVAYEPHVLLMDEPFAAVDAQTRADLEDLIRVLWQRLRVTVLFVTHDIDELVYLGQRVLVMSHAPTVIMEDVRHRPARRTHAARDAVAGAFRRVAQAHLFANPARQAGLASALRVEHRHCGGRIATSNNVPLQRLPKLPLTSISRQRRSHCNSLPAPSHSPYCCRS